MRKIRVNAYAYAFALASVSHTASALPTFAEVKAAHRPSDITVSDRHGVRLQTVRVDAGARRLAWVPLAEVSPALLAAIVQSEDKRFWQHAGVDWTAAATSAWANLFNTKTRGASTLTMQLAGLVDAAEARPAGGRSVGAKVSQAIVASRLDAAWRKSEILEAYLNLVPFRGELVGIEAMSQTLFRKHASGLDAAEAAIAAALVRSPNARAEAVGERACGVLQTQGHDCTGVRAIAATALVRKGTMPIGEQLAPHLARRIVDPAGATVQPTTIDARIQRVAIASLRRQLAELRGRNVEDGAVLVLDNATGEVLAWVGSSGGELSGAAAVDGVVARRQPGSTLKPFVYQLALEKRLLTPATLIDDSPAEIATGNGLYRPQNYDRSWKGPVSVRTALGASLNVPAVRVGAMVGGDALHERLQQLGFALPQPAGWYGASLALGSADVTLLALTNAYRTLANGGRHTLPVMQQPALVKEGPAPVARAVPRPVRVGEAASAWLVADILADDGARIRTFGAASVLATRGFAAVKTGTSKDLRDNWCIGFTDRYTVGVWVGNASGEAMHDVSGTTGAAPVWQQVVATLHEGRVSKPPPMPAGIAAVRIAFDSKREPERREFFLAGTESAVVRATAEGAGSRRHGIGQPKDGSVFAIDPDIPPDAQRIVFEGEPGRFWLDGQPLGSSAGPLLWPPWPGRHRLTLVSPEGEPIETVSFEVRGAGVKKGAVPGRTALLSASRTAPPSPRR